VDGATNGVTDGERRRAHAFPWRSPVLLAAAAVAALIAVAVPLVLRAGGSTSRNLSASRATTLPPGSPLLGGGRPVVDGGDLGALSASDAGRLQAVVRAQLARTGTTGQPASGVTSAAGSGGAANSASSGGPGAGSGQVATATPAASLVRLGAPPPCAAAAQALGGTALGALVYEAGVRWNGEAAEVLAFQSTPPQLGVFVMALNGCQLLDVQSF